MSMSSYSNKSCNGPSDDNDENINNCYYSARNTETTGTKILYETSTRSVIVEDCDNSFSWMVKITAKDSFCDMRIVAVFLLMIVIFTLVVVTVSIRELQKKKRQRQHKASNTSTNNKTNIFNENSKNNYNNDNDDKCNDHRTIHGESNAITTSSPTTTDPKINRKRVFISRHNCANKGIFLYGYMESKKGFIDTWRQSELPNLIPPVLLKETQNKNDEQPLSRHITKQGSLLPNHNDVVNVYDYEEEEEEPEVYLDYAGSSLPTHTQLQSIYKNKSILANPHSFGPAATRSKLRIERMKKLLLDYFNGNPDYGHDESYGSNKDQSSSSWKNYQHPGYDIIFTSGATESLKMVSERFPWTTSSNLVYTHNSHTSVIGMRNEVLKNGGMFHCVDLKKLNDAEKKDFEQWGSKSGDARTRGTIKHLLVMPAECNFGGDRPNISHIIETARSASFSCIHENDDEDDNDQQKKVFGSNERKKQHLGDADDYVNQWYIMLDLAKAAATGPVNLQQLDPDFACISFYKMFGEPTGLGALFVKKTRVSMLTAATTSPMLMNAIPATSASKFQKEESLVETQQKRVEGNGNGAITMTNNQEIESKYTQNRSIPSSLRHGRRHYFGGGSVDAVLPCIDFAYPRSWRENKNNKKDVRDSEGSGSLESLVHGTVHFRGIASLLYGLREIDSLGGIDKISLHSKCLAAELVRRLKKLRHENGNHVIAIYGAWAHYDIDEEDIERKNTCERTADQTGRKIQSITSFETKLRAAPGPTVAFNIYRQDGSPVGYNEVSKLAALSHPPLQLRTGCFCNPGACQEALRLKDGDVIKNFLTSGHVCGDHKDVIDGNPTGAIRASFGKDSIWEDMDALVLFLSKMFVRNYQLESRDGISREKYLEVGNMSTDIERKQSCKVDTNKCDRTLSEMYIFPIKSCASMRVRKWKINRRTGRLAYDREFALVDATGTAMRLNSCPMMSQINPSIDLDQRTLTVVAQNMPKLVLSLDRDESNGYLQKSSDNGSIRVCGNSCGGKVWGSHDASKWFSSFLGVRCWLARHHRKQRIEVNSLVRTPLLTPSSLGELGSYGKKTEDKAFANEAPLLLVSQDSINILNSVLSSQGQKHVSARHFRPNLVVGGVNSSTIAALHEKKNDAEKRTNPEDDWSSVVFKKGTLELNAVGQCARCSMVDIDPSSGMKGKTLRALADYRRRNGEIVFGVFYSGQARNNTETLCSDEFVWIEEGDAITCVQ